MDPLISLSKIAIFILKSAIVFLFKLILSSASFLNAIIESFIALFSSRFAISTFLLVSSTFSLAAVTFSSDDKQPINVILPINIIIPSIKTVFSFFFIIKFTI